MAKHPAAHINAISEEGDKEIAVKYLQETWDELCDLKIEKERLEERIRVLSNTNARLQERLAEAEKQWGECSAGYQTLEKELAAEKANRERLQEALEPFARAANELDNTRAGKFSDDRMLVGCGLIVRDVRHARAVLSGKTGEAMDHAHRMIAAADPSKPGGGLTAPTQQSARDAKEKKEYWCTPEAELHCTSVSFAERCLACPLRKQVWER